MPNVGGFEFLEELSKLRKSLDLNSVVVMMFTSSHREEDREKAFSYPFVKDYITKGEVTPEELEEKILNACKS